MSRPSKPSKSSKKRKPATPSKARSPGAAGKGRKGGAPPNPGKSRPSRESSSESDEVIAAMKAALADGADFYGAVGGNVSFEPDAKDCRHGMLFVDEVRLSGFLWFPSEESLRFACGVFERERGFDYEEVLWTGTFDDLLRGDGEVAVDMRRRFRGDDGPGSKASRPVERAAVSAFARFLAEIGA